VFLILTTILVTAFIRMLRWLHISEKKMLYKKVIARGRVQGFQNPPHLSHQGLPLSPTFNSDLNIIAARL